MTDKYVIVHRDGSWGGAFPKRLSDYYLGWAHRAYERGDRPAYRILIRMKQ